MPRRPPDLPTELKGRAFAVAEGRLLGLTRRQLDHPDLRRAPYGTRTSEDDGLPGRCRAAITAVDPSGTRRAALSHVTAARLWGVPLPTPPQDEPIHVALRWPERSSRAAGIRGHVLCDDRAFVVQRQDLPVVDATTLFCQLAATLSIPDLVAVGDALVLSPRFRSWDDERPWTSVEDLQRRVDGFRGRGKRTAQAAVPLLRPGAASRPESLLRLLLRHPGWPEPEVNPAIRDSSGRLVAYPDLLYREWRVVVEYDGDQHRTSRAQYERDVQRLEELGAQGWRVVRVLSGDLFVTPDETVLRVRAALRQAGWR